MSSSEQEKSAISQINVIAARATASGTSAHSFV